MTTIYLVRHCESTGNSERKMQGRTDCDITPQGEQQLGHLQKRMAALPLDAIYSSPLQRARKTAKAICGDRSMEITIVPDLQEMSFGSWENKTWDQLYTDHPEDVGAWYSDPYSVRFEGGETFGDVEERVVAAILDIAKRHKGQTVAIASHGTPIRLFARYALQADKSLSAVDWPKNTSVSTFVFDDEGALSLQGYSDTAHLPAELVKMVIEPQRNK